jgi:hypothetical protein
MTRRRADSLLLLWTTSITIGIVATQLTPHTLPISDGMSDRMAWFLHHTGQHHKECALKSNATFCILTRERSIAISSVFT